MVEIAAERVWLIFATLQSTKVSSYYHGMEGFDSFSVDVKKAAFAHCQPTIKVIRRTRREIILLTASLTNDPKNPQTHSLKIQKSCTHFSKILALAPLTLASAKRARRHRQNVNICRHKNWNFYQDIYCHNFSSMLKLYCIYWMVNFQNIVLGTNKYNWKAIDVSATWAPICKNQRPCSRSQARKIMRFASASSSTFRKMIP